MGDYRLWVGLNIQMGFCIRWVYHSIEVLLPFIKIQISFEKNAKGIRLFKD